ncbi:MAG: DUF1801 domain-containing protein [Deltaproteobacteria bacterium]
MNVKNEALLPLFTEVKQLLTPYATWLTARKDEPGYYDLWSEKEIVVDGRRRKEVFFAGVIVQKSFVGFYFMPLYADDELSRVFGPELLGTLKGKSCFHLKRMTPAIRAQIEAALAAGWRLYEERGWV